MPLEEFKSSQPLTMGVELELQLVSLSDFDLTASARTCCTCWRASLSPATSRRRSPRA